MQQASTRTLVLAAQEQGPARLALGPRTHAVLAQPLVLQRTFSRQALVLSAAKLACEQGCDPRGPSSTKHAAKLARLLPTVGALLPQSGVVLRRRVALLRGLDRLDSLRGQALLRALAQLLFRHQRGPAPAQRSSARVQQARRTSAAGQQAAGRPNRRPIMVA